ncbi:MAG TPA: DUF47 family protein [Methanolinea sp.]|jgi:uncharacterized protein Yka (UPF0111/DUF47 family)|nr:MAG: hypothetical protein A4E36_00467 [Methanoregulaceae archaeon PtaB.Bin009]OPY40501.1 MAG: hypothetical protein A4E41_01350 [Methanoregulaceae archaeon PtaU1.Bin066]HII76682.1 DUF47 family protein [Methanolinea sp.]HNQ28731.1 DUF47 family protein [Methanolinea sp.]
MTKEKSGRNKGKKGVFEFIFPIEHDFEAMLVEQAEKTLECVYSLVQWLKKTPTDDPQQLMQLEMQLDAMRYDMEDKLMASFSTPFDRQDIYSLSRQMDYIVNYSYETAREIYAFEVHPDDAILGMAQALLQGTKCTAAGVRAMGRDKKRVEELIRSARSAMRMIDDIYIQSMASLLRTDNPMDAIRKREVYHHLRDAGRALRTTVDILHHAVVGLS